MMQPTVTGTATLVISPQQAPLFSINKKFTRRHSEKIKDTNITTNKISNIKHKGSLKNKRTFIPLVLPQTQEKPIILLSNTGTQSLFNLARYEVNANSSNTHNQTDQIRLIFKDIEDLKMPRFLINVTSSAAATDNPNDQETQVNPHANIHSSQTHQLQLNTHTPTDEFSSKLKFRKNVKCKKPTKKSKLNSNGDSLSSSNSSVPKQMIITPTASIRSFSSSFDSSSSATALFSSPSSPSNSSSPSALLNFFNSSERRNSISSNSNKCQNLNFISGESVDDVESMGTNLAKSDEQENDYDKEDETTTCTEQKSKRYRKSLPSNADFSKIITANSNSIVLDLNSNLINNHEAKIEEEEEEEEEEVNDDDGDDGLEIIDTNMKSALITKKLSINRSVPNLLKNQSEDSPLLLTNNNDIQKHKSNETLTHTSKKSNNLFQEHKSDLELASQAKFLDTVINNRTNSSNSPVSYHCFTNLIISSKKFSQRYKLLTEGDLQVCKLQHSRNVLSKLLNSKLLRRWKAHRIILTDTEIYSTTKTDYMDSSIPYHMITEINPISKWEPGQKYCLRVATIECHYLFQTNNIYVRDQWIHSILWKKHKFKSERVLRNAVRPEVLIREIKNMIDMSTTTPIDDTEISQHPLELVSEILQKHKLPRQTHEEVIVALSPLLEKNHPSPEICDFFSRHCRDSPRSHIVIEMFSPVVQRILKHNGDFGRYPRMRLFVQDYLMALVSQNGGLQTVQNFVVSMHSLSSQCPFPRVLPNFVSVCLASIHSCFETHWHKSLQPVVQLSLQEQEDQLLCHTTMMYTMSNFEDWRVNLAQLLQSVPFPDQALTHEKFIKIFKNVVKNFAQDSRCEVHQTLLGIREGKEGWFEIFCPGGVSCDDNGELFSIMLQTLISCCCKKKRFLLSINKLLTNILSLAAREVSCAIETLCAMLDLDGVEDIENKLKIINTLQSTELGLKHYAKVCERQLQLRELQQKGGPRKLTLPSRSTDEDLAKLLLSGSFGNLECLSLAFTNVTSACAEYLIKLPSLRYLNLWSTKFGDQGLELISEHLQRLQVLNLCETPVTDKGLACLASMKQLRKLNLNSTNLSALTFEGLKECLPALQECDIRYTDAW